MSYERNSSRWSFSDLYASYIDSFGRLCYFSYLTANYGIERSLFTDALREHSAWSDKTDSEWMGI